MTDPTYTAWSFGRFVHDYKMTIGVVSMMVVGIFALWVPRPQTQEELLLWLEFGTGLLSFFASVCRIAGHRDVRWPTAEISLGPEDDDEWTQRYRAARQLNKDVDGAIRASYDYLGKFLALDAAIFALMTTAVHLIFMSVG